AFVASVVCNVIWLSRYVSTSWASAMGAVTSSRGSFANSSRPSGTPQTSPVKRREENASSVASSKPIVARYSRAAGSKLKPSSHARQSWRAGCDQESPVGGQPANEQAERRGGRHAPAEIARSHVELVEIR